MKQIDREFVYITRVADTIARERKEKFNLTSEDFVEDRAEMIVEAISQNVKELVECTNASGHQEQVIEGIVNGLTSSHRYLQGEFMQALSKALAKYSTTHTDARNEAGVRMAGRMAQIALHPEIEPSDIQDILGRR